MPTPVPPLPADDLDHVLAHTSGLWSEARGARFFITGGTGFFGLWLLESWARANDRLGLGMHATVLSRDPAAFARKAPHLARRRDLALHAGDVRTFAFPTGRFDRVVHAATEASVQLIEQAPGEMLDVIVTGTGRVLDFAAQAGTRQLLFTSSGAVYGSQPAELARVPESYSAGPAPLASVYGEGKRQAEKRCVEHGAHHGCEVKIARCFAFVGPHLPLDTHFAIGNFIRDARAGRDIAVQGDGSPRRSYLYAADLAAWLWTILFRGVSGRAYNVGSMTEVSIADLAATVARVAGRGARVSIANPAPAGRPAARYVPDTTLAQHELGLQEWIDLPAALRRTLAWLEAA